MNSEENRVVNKSGVPVNESRRSFAKVSVVTPVIMTLVSKPVFAFQGLSNMLSVKPSDCRGDDRHGGLSPGFWKDPNGSVSFGGVTYSGEIAWFKTGYSYGTTTCTSHGKGQGQGGCKWDDYTGGTKFVDVFGAGYLHADESLREILNKYNSDSWEGIKVMHLIAGLLNAKYFDAIAVEHTSYIFTYEQFLYLFNNNIELLAKLCSNEYYDKNSPDCV